MDAGSMTCRMWMDLQHHTGGNKYSYLANNTLKTSRSGNPEPQDWVSLRLYLPEVNPNVTPSIVNAGLDPCYSMTL